MLHCTALHCTVEYCNTQCRVVAAVRLTALHLTAPHHTVSLSNHIIPLGYGICGRVVPGPRAATHVLERHQNSAQNGQGEQLFEEAGSGVHRWDSVGMSLILEVLFFLLIFWVFLSSFLFICFFLSFFLRTVFLAVFLTFLSSSNFTETFLFYLPSLHFSNRLHTLHLNTHTHTHTRISLYSLTQ